MSNPLNTIPSVEVEEGALGAVVKDPAKRARIYAVNTIAGIVLMAVIAALMVGAGAALACIAIGLHVALTIPVVALAAVSAAYTAVQPQVSALARANTTTN